MNKIPPRSYDETDDSLSSYDVAYALSKGAPPSTDTAYAPSSTDAAHAPSSTDAAYAPSSTDAAHAPSSTDAAYAPSSTDAAHAPSSTDAAYAPSSTDAAYAPSSTDASMRRVRRAALRKCDCDDLRKFAQYFNLGDKKLYTLKKKQLLQLLTTRVPERDWNTAVSGSITLNQALAEENLCEFLKSTYSDQSIEDYMLGHVESSGLCGDGYITIKTQSQGIKCIQIPTDIRRLYFAQGTKSTSEIYRDMDLDVKRHVIQDCRTHRLSSGSSIAKELNMQEHSAAKLKQIVNQYQSSMFDQLVDILDSVFARFDMDDCEDEVLRFLDDEIRNISANMAKTSWWESIKYTAGEWTNAIKAAAKKAGRVIKSGLEMLLWGMKLVAQKMQAVLNLDNLVWMLKLIGKTGMYLTVGAWNLTKTIAYALVNNSATIRMFVSCLKHLKPEVNAYILDFVLKPENVSYLEWIKPFLKMQSESRVEMEAIRGFSEFLGRAQESIEARNKMLEDEMSKVERDQARLKQRQDAIDSIKNVRGYFSYLNAVASVITTATTEFVAAGEDAGVIPTSWRKGGLTTALQETVGAGMEMASYTWNSSTEALNGTYEFLQESGCLDFKRHLGPALKGLVDSGAITMMFTAMAGPAGGFAASLGTKVIGGLVSGVAESVVSSSAAALQQWTLLSDIKETVFMLIELFDMRPLLFQISTKLKIKEFSLDVTNQIRKEKKVSAALMQIYKDQVYLVWNPDAEAKHRLDALQAETEKWHEQLIKAILEYSDGIRDRMKELQNQLDEEAKKDATKAEDPDQVIQEEYSIPNIKANKTSVQDVVYNMNSVEDFLRRHLSEGNERIEHEETGGSSTEEGEASYAEKGEVTTESYTQNEEEDPDSDDKLKVRLITNYIPSVKVAYGIGIHVYRWKTREYPWLPYDKDTHFYGVSAQEVQAIYPSGVRTDPKRGHLVLNLKRLPKGLRRVLYTLNLPLCKRRKDKSAVCYPNIMVLSC